MHTDSRGYLERAGRPGGCMSSFNQVSADAKEKNETQRESEREREKLFSVSSP